MKLFDDMPMEFVEVIRNYQSGSLNEFEAQTEVDRIASINPCLKSYRDRHLGNLAESLKVEISQS